jgi:1,4-alpha-glucan branching enzyme
MAMLFVLVGFGYAQPVVDMSVQDGALMLIVKRQGDLTQVDSLVKDLGYPSVAFLDSAWNAGWRDVKSDLGWTLIKRKDQSLAFRKPMGGQGKAFPSGPPRLVLPDLSWLRPDIVQVEADHAFGFNDFKERTVRFSPNGRSHFRLPDNADARGVILAGSFNDWSTSSTAMTRTDSGWVATLTLPPGRYTYKFIVDGRWQEDKYNRNKEPDGHMGYNSVVYVPNHEFTLAGYPKAKRVYVTGSFNNWKEKQLAMTKTPSGWVLPAWFREGTYSYKFIVDKDWITDPTNPVVRDDGAGNQNSFFALGDTTWFTLQGFVNARSVVLAGSFNEFNGNELQMERSGNGWTLGHVLAPGNYGYKFVVDGNWITDPANPVAYGPEDLRNSLHVEEPNYRMRVKGLTDASEVLLSGDFNGWLEEGYTMQRDAAGWYLDLNLKPGKYRYKLLVGGEWILDPSNPQWEENEYGTGNSVIWVESASAGTP